MHQDLNSIRQTRTISPALLTMLILSVITVRSTPLNAQTVEVDQPHPSSVSARAAVEHAIRVAGGIELLRKVATLETHEIHAAYRLTDSDHPAGPFLVEPSEMVRWVDMLHDEAVSQTDTRLASGDRHVATVIYRQNQSEMRSRLNDRQLPTQLTPAPQNWNLAFPFEALLAAFEAVDLKKVGVSLLNGTPHTLIRFTHEGQPVTLELNDENGYVDSITRQICMPYNIANSIWGDYKLRSVFGDWRLEKGGFHYPFLTTIYFNGTLQETDIIKDLQVNPPTDNLSLVASSPVAQNAIKSPANVDDIPLGNSATKSDSNPGTGPVEIAPGVLQIPGNWYTTVIRQEDGLVVIDAPISSGYSRQVIDAAKQHFPGLPIKAVITSTSYWWHFAGIREYAAKGIPIYVLDSNESLIRSALTAPHITHPDDLALAKTKWKLIPVSHATAIGTGANMIVLYPIREATGQMMMTWFPKLRMLYTAEMAQPLGPDHTFLFPQALWELQQSVQGYGLPVEKIIGMHMSPTAWSLLVQSIGNAVAGEQSTKS